MKDAVLGVEKGERGVSNGGQSGTGKSRYLPPHLRGKPGGAGGVPDDRPQRDLGDDRIKERGTARLPVHNYKVLNSTNYKFY